MLDLYLVRHAPVIDKQGVIYGDDAGVDLESCQEGLTVLAQALPAPDEALWFSSGVSRAHKTAQAVLQLKGAPGQLLHIDRGFREQDFGSLTGQAHEDVQEHVTFVQGRIYTPDPPDGERISFFIERVSQALIRVREQAEQKGKSAVVVFAHGGTLRAAHFVLEHLNESEFINLDTPPLGVYSASL